MEDKFETAFEINEKLRQGNMWNIPQSDFKKATDDLWDVFF
jgi:hypothetical protein